MPDETVRIVIEGKDKASRAFGKASGALASIGKIAAGILGAKVLGGIAKGMADAAKQAIEISGKYEMLARSLHTLVGREIREASAVDEVIKIGQTRLALSAKEREELEKLTKRETDLAARISITNQRIGEASARKKVNQSTMMSLNDTLRKQQREYDEVTGRIEELNTKEGALVNVMKRVTSYGLTQNEAMKKAGRRTKELLDWLDKLIIKSPIGEKTLTYIMQQAMGVGMTSEKAQELTQALIDYGAATGLTEDEVRSLAKAFSQIHSATRLQGQDMLQLTNAGLGYNVVARAVGIKTDEVRDAMKDGNIAAEKLIDGFITLTSEDFAGSGAAMATSWGVLGQTLDDIRQRVLRKLFGEFNVQTGEMSGILGVLQPFLITFVDKLSDPAFLDNVSKLGEALGEKLAGGIRAVQHILSTFTAEGLAGVFKELWEGRVLWVGLRGTVYRTRGLKEVFVELGENLPGWITEGLIPKASELWDAFEELGFAKGLLAWLEEHRDEIVGVGSAIGKVVAAGLNLSIYNAVKKDTSGDLKKAAKETTWQDIGKLIGEALMEGFSAAVAESWEVWKTMMRRKIKEWWTKQSSLEELGEIGGLPFLNLRREQTGTPFFGGGLALVGEGGPELVALSRGSRIYNARDTARMTGGAIFNITINANGGDPYAIAEASRYALELGYRKARLAGGIR